MKLYFYNNIFHFLLKIDTINPYVDLFNTVLRIIISFRVLEDHNKHL
jgi:hypothetical protein